MIALQNITKSYTTASETVMVLDDFSLSVQAGEFVAVMGPSGSGKSTLLGLVSGLIEPDSGIVQL